MEDGHIAKKILLVIVLTILAFPNLFYRYACAAPRVADPVIVSTSKMPFLQRLPVGNFRIFASVKGTFNPIPFQIDEKSSEEDYVFPKGAKSKKKDYGRIGEFDELVFMSKDSGDRVPKNKIPYGFEKGAEIEINDPLTKGKSYVYLLYSRNVETMPVSDKKYINAAGKQWVEGTYYRVGRSTEEQAEKHQNIVDYFAILKDAGGNGENILDRVKYRSRVVALGGTVRFERDESNFRTQLIAELDGPIRTISHFKNSVYLIMRITTPPQTYNVTYYYNGYITPVYIDIPIDLSIIKNLVKTAYFQSTLDFNESAIGMFYYNPLHKRGILIDGKPSRKEENIEKEPFQWVVIAGEKQGAWMLRVVPPKKNFPLGLNCYFVDDITKPDSPEGIKGQIGNMGFTVSNIMEAKAGRHKVLTYVYFLPGYKPGDEKAYLNIEDNPLQVKVEEL